ncbi:MAG: O-antigen ligase family protein, partial [Fuerstiella sp.]
MRKIGNVLSRVSAAIAVITVASLPWMLGGVVPVARAVLLIGAVAAGLLSLLANRLRGRRPSSLPLVAVPLTVLVLLGTWQLRSAPNPLNFINHGVTASSDILTFEGTSVASLSPPDTRSIVGTLIAATILSFVCFDQIQSLRTIAVVVFFLVLNGVSIMAVGLSQQLKGTVFPLNEPWSLGRPGGFAPFWNTNNAAGWLCLCFGMACGWLTYQLKPASVDARLRTEAAKTSLLDKCTRPVFQFFADLDVWRILPFLAVALLAVGVAATKSRGGILALVVSMAATLAFRSSRRRLPTAVLIVAVCGAGVYGLLEWLDLDQGVITEMETLQDLDAAAGARPAHWLASLHAVLDFPFAGTGLGSYRFAT